MFKMPSGKRKGKRLDKLSIAKLDPNVCVFCNSCTNEEEMYGKLIRRCNMTVHYFCMLFSSGLSQGGKSEESGIFGFLPEDIMKEVRRGQRLRCFYCKMKGATIGCVVGTCRRVFHFGCGKKNGTLHQYYDSYRSFCDDHRPRQAMPVSDRLAFYGTANTLCAICMISVEARTSNETLRAPCCRNSWFHRLCIEKHAQAAGLYFFKCPLCNNKEIFQEEMLKFGIYLPDQDAAWEREPNAYNELLERYLHCDSAVCICPHDRDYNRDGGKWEILVCDWCGSKGSHVECNGLEKRGSDFVCLDCCLIDNKQRETRAKKKEAKFAKSPATAKGKGSAAEPNLQDKGKSEYPGKSDMLRKKSLPVPSSSPRLSAQKVSPGMVLRLSYDETDDDVDIGDLSDVQPSTSGEAVLFHGREKRKRNSKSTSRKRLKLDVEELEKGTDLSTPNVSIEQSSIKTLTPGKNNEYDSSKKVQDCKGSIRNKTTVLRSSSSPRKSALLIQRKRESARKPKFLRSFSSLLQPTDKKAKRVRIKKTFTDEMKKSSYQRQKLRDRSPFSSVFYRTRKYRRSHPKSKKQSDTSIGTDLLAMSSVNPTEKVTEAQPEESNLQSEPLLSPVTKSVPSIMSLLTNSCSHSDLPKPKKKYKKKMYKSPESAGQTSITQWLTGLGNNSQEDKTSCKTGTENNKNILNNSPTQEHKNNGNTLIFKWKGRIFKVRKTLRGGNGGKQCAGNGLTETQKFTTNLSEEMLKSSKYEATRSLDLPKGLKYSGESMFLDSVHKSPVSFSPAKCTRNALTEMKKSASCTDIMVTTPPTSSRKLRTSSSKKLASALEKYSDEFLIHSSKHAKCSLSEKFEDSTLDSNRAEVDSNGEASDISPMSSSSLGRLSFDQQPDFEGLNSVSDQENELLPLQHIECENSENSDVGMDVSMINDLQECLEEEISDDDEENKNTSTYIIQSFGGSHGYQQLSISVPNH